MNDAETATTILFIM